MEVDAGVLVEAVLLAHVHQRRRAPAVERPGVVVRGPLRHAQLAPLQRGRVQFEEAVALRLEVRVAALDEAHAPLAEPAHIDVRELVREGARRAVFVYVQAAAQLVHIAAAVGPVGHLVYHLALGDGLFQRPGGLLRVAAGLFKLAGVVVRVLGREKIPAAAERADIRRSTVQAQQLLRLAAVVGQAVEHGQRHALLRALPVLFLPQRGEADALVREEKAVHVPGGGEAAGAASVPDIEVGLIAVLLHVRAPDEEIDVLPAHGRRMRHQEAGKELIVHFFHVFLSPLSNTLAASSPKGKPVVAPARLSIRSSTSALPRSSSACEASISAIASAQSRKKRQ